ncbi:MAG: hypothetical protein U0694_14355 [Anaerolineae bacterium]
MFKAITSSLRTKIVIGALIALFVPIALLVGYNTLNARATLLEDDTASEVSIIQAQAENVSDTLALLESNTQFLASAPATGRYADFLAGAEDPEAQAFAERCISLISTRISARLSATSVSLITADRKCCALTIPKVPPESSAGLT